MQFSPTTYFLYDDFSQSRIPIINVTIKIKNLLVILECKRGNSQGHILLAVTLER